MSLPFSKKSVLILLRCKMVQCLSLLASTSVISDPEIKVILLVTLHVCFVGKCFSGVGGGDRVSVQMMAGRFSGQNFFIGRE